MADAPPISFALHPTRITTGGVGYPNAFAFMVANTTDQDLRIRNPDRMMNPDLIPGCGVSISVDRFCFGLSWKAGTDPGDLFGADDEASDYGVDVPDGFTAKQTNGPDGRDRLYWLLWPRTEVLLKAWESLVFPITRFITTAPPGMSYITVCAVIGGYQTGVTQIPVFKVAALASTGGPGR